MVVMDSALGTISIAVRLITDVDQILGPHDSELYYSHSIVSVPRAVPISVSSVELVQIDTGTHTVTGSNSVNTLVAASTTVSMDVTAIDGPL